jgi:hypothetical protein
MDPYMLDGNAAAGVLGEIFATEMTTAIGTCAGCGAAGAVGATHLYRGAGVVLRCSRCDAVLFKIVEGAGRVWIALPGVRSLELRATREDSG